jgi:hypothetical protein
VQGTGAAADAGAIGVSAGYFATFSIPIRVGREFTTAESAGETPLAVVSETLARRLWPAEPALGKVVRAIEQTPAGPTPGPWRTVVGIARDVRQTYDDAATADFYTPRMPDGRFGTFYVRTSLSPPLLFDHLRGVAAEIDPNAIVNPPRMVSGDDQALAGTRFLTILLSVFAAVAAFLAMLGIYGATAYAVQQRRKEVAIRLALGATTGAVVRIFVRDGAVLLGLGTTAGLIGGVALARTLRHQVFAVHGFDPLTFAVAATLLLAAGFLAIFRGARAAAHTDPASALNAG